MFAVDYLETGGVVDWDDSDHHRQLIWSLDSLQQASRANANKPEPFSLAGRSVLVHASGMGRGRQNRLTYLIEWRGVVFAFSIRSHADRRNANFYLKVTGEPCLLVGAQEARDAVREMIADLGGMFRDEWLKRIDLCLDVPGLCLRDELQPAFDAGWYLAELPNRSSYDHRGKKTGFSAKSNKRCKLNVYDKLLDATTQHPGDYLQGMIDRRWGGKLPAEATRIEYQLFRSWLTSYGLDQVDDVLADLGSIVAKLTSFGPRPAFLLTDSEPDRDNKHQSRCEPLPVWRGISERFRRAAGEPRRFLQPVRRGEASYRQLYWMIFGGMTTAAARLGLMVESVDDCLAVLRRLQENAGKADGEIAERCEEKMRKLGTWDEWQDSERRAA